ncbi:uncharacterized protein DUF2795 [Nocardiopsis sp. Huas11]|uniref:DUF2795 domain-containing protein n=1 Tax=Nocardiopsis sp. Huas11 TaxID=2183912 RepID=UPI000EB0626E|nr:DUF2795 domain-containing protein [Nocardiopsis sp. Huas11]RKS08400.1 uncharacterized protein DUF2795 [Nocardiopsis sp. Huas11]
MVTRTDIAHYLDGAFTSGGITRRQIIHIAGRRGAPEPVLDTLGLLPEGTYANLRTLWPHLREVPRSV